MVNPSNQPQSFTAVPTVCTSESQHRAAILAEATIAEIKNLGSNLISYRYLSTFLFFWCLEVCDTWNASLVAFFHKASAASLKVTIRHFTDRINTPDFRTNGTRSENKSKNHGEANRLGVIDVEHHGGDSSLSNIFSGHPILRHFFFKVRF